MKKIMLASESKQFTRVAMDFLSEWEDQKFFVVGRFSHALSYAELVQTSAQPYLGLVVDLVEQDRHAVDENVRSFELSCKRHGIKYRVHEEISSLDISRLIKETRFADLLIVDLNLFGNDSLSDRNTSLIKRALHQAECPVLLLPRNFTKIEKIAITYDGNKDSMIALKQCCCLFPHLLELPAEIVYLSRLEAIKIPEVELVEEYAIQNFSSVNVSIVHTSPEYDLANWATDKKDLLVIAGSYGRSGSNYVIADSFIDPILKGHHLPVFIAHH